MTSAEPKIPKAGQFSIKETAEILGASRTTIWRWTKMGYLKAKYHRVNKRPFFTGDEIIRFWKSTF